MFNGIFNEINDSITFELCETSKTKVSYKQNEISILHCQNHTIYLLKEYTNFVIFDYKNDYPAL